MAINLHGLRTAIYPTTDLDASKRWWSELLGIEPYFDEPFYVGFNVGGYELGLLPDGDLDDGAQIYWGVDDVEASVGAALAAGAVTIAPASDVGEGIVTATVRSPDGSVVGFIHNPHFTAE
jgi:catechol 2,3-dioxygenase-like lactoylglutathione lyase family enzyme